MSDPLLSAANSCDLSTSASPAEAAGRPSAGGGGGGGPPGADGGGGGGAPAARGLGATFGFSDPTAPSFAGDP
jgi:hypothetical protein